MNITQKLAQQLQRHGVAPHANNPLAGPTEITQYLLQSIAGAGKMTPENEGLFYSFNLGPDSGPTTFMQAPI